MVLQPYVSGNYVTWHLFFWFIYNYIVLGCLGLLHKSYYVEYSNKFSKVISSSCLESLVMLTVSYYMTAPGMTRADIYKVDVPIRHVQPLSSAYLYIYTFEKK